MNGNDTEADEQARRTQPLESEAPDCPEERREGPQGAGAEAEGRAMTFSEAASIFE